MQTKEELIQSVKHWLAIDNEIAELQKQMREKRKLKKELSTNLITVMKTHNIDCLDIKNAKLVHTKRKQKQSISKKFLLETLQKYYEDGENAKTITDFILNSREEKEIDNIKIKK
tara:strand:+ start:64 stop:408 length:345 start_codon:yes stop_codon:yes gene_type:complete